MQCFKYNSYGNQICSGAEPVKEVFAKHRGCTSFYGNDCRMSKKERHQPTNAVVLHSQGAGADTGAAACRRSGHGSAGSAPGGLQF